MTVVSPLTNGVFLSGPDMVASVLFLKDGSPVRSSRDRGLVAAGIGKLTTARSTRDSAHEPSEIK